MQRDQAYQAVSTTFGEYFEVHPAQVLAHHELREDWGLCTSELELLACHIEERAGVELSDHSALFELKTVGQLVQLVRAQLRRASGKTGRA
jgi:acyl carrier protein